MLLKIMIAKVTSNYNNATIKLHSYYFTFCFFSIPSLSSIHASPILPFQSSQSSPNSTRPSFPPTHISLPLPLPPTTCSLRLSPRQAPRHLQRPRNSTRRGQETNSANPPPRGSCHLPQAGQTAVVSPLTPRLSRRRRCRHVQHWSERGGSAGRGALERGESARASGKMQ